MSSRIEQIIDEIEEYIDNCKFQPLSTSKIIVNKDQMDELLRELRMKTPDEIKRYQKIIANKDAILADAQSKADSMIEEAQIQTSELVSEHEIMQQAYSQANEIVTAATEQAQEILDHATRDANDIRIGAMQYTDDLLANAESIIGHTLDSYTTKYDGLVNSLQECYDMVRNNRSELGFRISLRRDWKQSMAVRNMRVQNQNRNMCLMKKAWSNFALCSAHIQFDFLLSDQNNNR